MMKAGVNFGNGTMSPVRLVEVRVRVEVQVEEDRLRMNATR